MRPQTGLPEAFSASICGIGAQRSVGRRARARRAARTAARRRSRCRVAQPALRVREGERERARRRSGSWYFCASAFGRVSIGRDAGREERRTDCAGREPDPLAEAEDRIEHDAGRARQRRPSSAAGIVSVSGRGRGMRARSVSHSTGPCGRPSRLKTCTAQIGLSRGSRGRRWQSSAALSGRYSVSRNSLPNAGCARSSAGGREHDLRVAGDVDLADPRALIDDRQPPDLDVVLGRHGDVELGRSCRRRGAEASPDPRGTRRGSRRARRASADSVADQTVAAAHVAQVDELSCPDRASRRARDRVTARPRQKLRPPPALVTIDDVVAVRQELRVRNTRVRRSEPPHRHRRRRQRRRACRRAGARLSIGACARHAFLQQQFGRLHARVGVKALHHPVADAARWPAPRASCPGGAPGDW